MIGINSPKYHDRPGDGVIATTPRAANMMRFLGSGESRGAVSMTRDEFAAVKRMYGYAPESGNGPVREFMQAGADRNALRRAEADGLRLVAWLARYVPSGEDPLKTLIQVASDAGFDVDPEDFDWATADGCPACGEADCDGGCGSPDADGGGA